MARQLIPQLAEAPTAQQVAGGWRIEAGKVLATEDRLTALVDTAPDQTRASRARALRDAVRGARTRLDTLDQIDDPAGAGALLRTVSDQLEAALAVPSTQHYAAGATGRGQHG